MKKIILFCIVISAISANGQQSLKDALFSGKLKMDSGKVIRKTDDLSNKIDTVVRKQPMEPQKTQQAVALTGDSLSAAPLTQQGDATTIATGVTTETNAAPKDNNTIWKEYIEELTGTLRTEVLPNKKIKNGTYSILIEYEIDVDGQTTVKTVSCDPESSYLEQQVKERMLLSSPQMTPLLGNTGKPRKAIKKYTMILSK